MAARRNKLLTNQKFQMSQIREKHDLREAIGRNLVVASNARPQDRRRIRNLRRFYAGANYQLNQVRNPNKYIAQTHRLRKRSKAAEARDKQRVVLEAAAALRRAAAVGAAAVPIVAPLVG